MVNKRELIKVHPFFSLLIITFLIIGFIILIMISNKQASNYVALSFEMKLDSIEISGDEKYGNLRGAIFFKKDYYIATSARFIGDDCDYNNWIYNGPNIDLNTKPHKYTLDDLGLPFLVYKMANNDTLQIIKNGCLIKFLIN
ncbi:MAG: hypothetical protein JXB00_15225 [Bacteroidales bacterium]|nr:hypothetical protein [Bacteroidales bacterium]